MKDFIISLNTAQNLIEPCEISDIDIHYDIVKDLIKDTVEEENYKNAMLECIENSTAYKVTGKNCFLYYLKITEYESKGVCFYGKHDPKNMMVLLSGIFNTIDTVTNILKFSPHKDKDIKYYKSLLVRGSIKKYYITNSPVTLRIDTIRNKIRNIVSRKVSNG